MVAATVDQQRAFYAYSCEGRAAYAKEVRDLPALMLRSGLCAAIAEIERRKRPDLLADLERWARVRSLIGAGDLASEARTCTRDRYISLSRELLALAVWMKRAAGASK